MGKGGGGKCGREQVGMDAGSAGAASAVLVQPGRPRLDPPDWKQLDLLMSEEPEKVAAFEALMKRRRVLHKRDQWIEKCGNPIAKPANFRAVFEGFEHPPSGLRLRVPEHDEHNSTRDHRTGELIYTATNPHYLRGRLTITTEICDGDRVVGLAEYDLNIDRKGDLNLSVATNRLRMNPTLVQEGEDPEKYMGRGFGAALQAHVEQRMAEAGVHRMTLGAVGTGSYVWGRYGYHYRPPRSGEVAGQPLAGGSREWAERMARGTLTTMCFTAEALERDGRIPRQLRAQVQQLAESPEVPLTPNELGQIGREHPFEHKGRSTWLGQLTLESTTWAGVKLLQRR